MWVLQVYLIQDNPNYVKPLTQNQPTNVPTNSQLSLKDCDGISTNSYELIDPNITDLISKNSTALNYIRDGYVLEKKGLSSLVEKILVMPDLDMTEHVRIELQRANERPEIVNHLHEVALLNYEKNLAANKTASEYLEGEWKKRRRGELERELRSAEARGDDEAVQRLLKQFQMI